MSRTMGGFLARVGIFASLVIAVFGGLCFLEIRAEVEKYREEVKVPPGASVLVCNDSQTGSGIDPSVCSNVFNFSTCGRTLDQAYLTMVDVLDRNPGRIRTVVFDVNPVSAVASYSPRLDQMGFAGKFWLLHYLHPGRTIRDLTTGLVVMRDNMVGRRLRHFWRAVRGLVEFESSLGGRFFSTDEVMKKTRPKAYELAVQAKAKAVRGLSDLTLESPFVTKVLDPVVALAHERGVNLLLITTPWNEDLRAAGGERELAAFTELMNRYADSRRCPYEDFLRFEMDTSCWGDGNHPTRKGARVLTEALARSLERRGML